MSRTATGPMTRRMKVFAALVAFVAAVYGALHVFRDDMAFSSEEWKRAGPAVFNVRSPRGRMHADLRARVLKAGMRRDEVLQLLGEPDQPRDGKELVYYIGPAQYVPEAAFVIVEFKDDILLRHRIATD